MEKYIDPSETEAQQLLKKLEELNPQAYDYAHSLCNAPRDEFFSGISILNEKEEQPPAEGIYELVHFPTGRDRNLSAKLFENGRITFSGTWNE